MKDAILNLKTEVSNFWINTTEEELKSRTYAKFYTCRIMAENKFDEDNTLSAIVLQLLEREEGEVACDRNAATQMTKALSIRPGPAPRIV